MKHPNWETFHLKIKGEETPVSFVFSYKSSKNNYSPMIVGLNYNKNEKYSCYRQTLYQLLHQTKRERYSKLFLGMEANMEKSKIGSTAIPKSVYLQANDNFNMEKISLILTQNKS